MKEDLVLKEEKVYVLKDKELQVEIIKLYHNILVVGYEGRWKMTELVMRNYWWLGVTRDMRRYIERCDIYQRIKNRTEVLVGKLKLSKVLEKLWTHLTVNFITKLPIIAGKDVILVIYDRLSKIVHFVATTEGMLVEGLAQLFRDNVWKLHRLPESVVSDQEL